MEEETEEKDRQTVENCNSHKVAGTKTEKTEGSTNTDWKRESPKKRKAKFTSWGQSGFLSSWHGVKEGKCE